MIYFQSPPLGPTYNGPGHRLGPVWPRPGIRAMPALPATQTRSQSARRCRIKNHELNKSIQAAERIARRACEDVWQLTCGGKYEVLTQKARELDLTCQEHL